jgi:uncharacterized iron-regulated membrane protein
MLLIIVLNAVFCAFVVFTIAGLHLWAIQRSRADQAAHARASIPDRTPGATKRRRAVVARPAMRPARG